LFSQNLTTKGPNDGPLSYNITQVATSGTLEHAP